MWQGPAPEPGINEWLLKGQQGPFNPETGPLLPDPEFVPN
jgi:hypothetical protein